MLTTILLAIIVLVLAARGAHWLIKYHVQALNTEREKRNNNYLAAKLLADEIETARYSAAYYKTALEEIIRTTHPTNGAHEIARRFLKLDDETGDDE